MHNCMYACMAMTFITFVINDKDLFTLTVFKGEVSQNNNADWVSRKQFYKPNIKSLSRF